MGGIGGLSAMVGGAFGALFGWAKGKQLKAVKAKEAEAKLSDTVNRAVEDLIGNLRTDCAEARKDAKEAKGQVEHWRAEHQHCRDELTALGRRIDELMGQKLETPPVRLPRPVPAPRRPGAPK